MAMNQFEAEQALAKTTAQIAKERVEADAFVNGTDGDKSADWIGEVQRDAENDGNWALGVEEPPAPHDDEW